MAHLPTPITALQVVLFCVLAGLTAAGTKSFDAAAAPGRRLALTAADVSAADDVVITNLDGATLSMSNLAAASVTVVGPVKTSTVALTRITTGQVALSDGASITATGVSVANCTVASVYLGDVEGGPGVSVTKNTVAGTLQLGAVTDAPVTITDNIVAATTTAAEGPLFGIHLGGVMEKTGAAAMALDVSGNTVVLHSGAGFTIGVYMVGPFLGLDAVTVSHNSATVTSAATFACGVYLFGEVRGGALAVSRNVALARAEREARGVFVLGRAASLSSLTAVENSATAVAGASFAAALQFGGTFASVGTVTVARNTATATAAGTSAASIVFGAADSVTHLNVSDNVGTATAGAAEARSGYWDDEQRGVQRLTVARNTFRATAASSAFALVFAFNASGYQDAVVSANTAVAAASGDGAVALAFDHVASALRFAVEGNNATSTAASNAKAGVLFGGASRSTTVAFVDNTLAATAGSAYAWALWARYFTDVTTVELRGNTAHAATPGRFAAALFVGDDASTAVGTFAVKGNTVTARAAEQAAAVVVNGTWAGATATEMSGNTASAITTTGDVALALVVNGSYAGPATGAGSLRLTSNTVTATSAGRDAVALYLAPVASVGVAAVTGNTVTATAAAANGFALHIGGAVAATELRVAANRATATAASYARALVVLGAVTQVQVLNLTGNVVVATAATSIATAVHLAGPLTQVTTASVAGNNAKAVVSAAAGTNAFALLLTGAVTGTAFTAEGNTFTAESGVKAYCAFVAAPLKQSTFALRRNTMASTASVTSMTVVLQGSVATGTTVNVVGNTLTAKAQGGCYAVAVRFGPIEAATAVSVTTNTIIASATGNASYGIVFTADATLGSLDVSGNTATATTGGLQAYAVYAAAIKATTVAVKNNTLTASAVTTARALGFGVLQVTNMAIADNTAAASVTADDAAVLPLLEPHGAITVTGNALTAAATGRGASCAFVARGLDGVLGTPSTATLHMERNTIRVTAARLASGFTVNSTLRGSTVRLVRNSMVVEAAAMGTLVVIDAAAEGPGEVRVQDNTLTLTVAQRSPATAAVVINGDFTAASWSGPSSVLAVLGNVVRTTAPDFVGMFDLRGSIAGSPALAVNGNTVTTTITAAPAPTARSLVAAAVGDASTAVVRVAAGGVVNVAVAMESNSFTVDDSAANATAAVVGGASQAVSFVAVGDTVTDVDLTMVRNSFGSSSGGVGILASPPAATGTMTWVFRCNKLDGRDAVRADVQASVPAGATLEQQPCATVTPALPNPSEQGSGQSSSSAGPRRTQTIVIPPLPPPDAVPDGLRGAADGTSVVGGAASGLLASPAAAAQLARTVAVLDLARVCSAKVLTAPDRHSLKPPLPTSPTQLGFGPDDGKYYRGGVVGNLLLLGVICLVVAVIAAVLSRVAFANANPEGGTPFQRAGALLRFPSNLLSIVAFFVLGTSQLATSAAVYGASEAKAYDLILGFLALLLVGALFAGLAYFFFRSTVMASVEYRDAIPLGPQTHCAVRGAFKVAGHRGEWRLRENHLHMDDLPKMQMFSFVYSRYRAPMQYFTLFDLGVSAVVGVILGLAPSVMCEWIPWVIAVIYTVFTAVMLGTRPYTNPVANVVHALIAGLSAVAAWLVAFGVWADPIDYDLIDLANTVVIIATAIAVAYILYLGVRIAVLWIYNRQCVDDPKRRTAAFAEELERELRGDRDYIGIKDEADLGEELGLSDLTQKSNARLGSVSQVRESSIPTAVGLGLGDHQSDRTSERDSTLLDTHRPLARNFSTVRANPLMDGKDKPAKKPAQDDDFSDVFGSGKDHDGDDLLFSPPAVPAVPQREGGSTLLSPGQPPSITSPLQASTFASTAPRRHGSDLDSDFGDLLSTPKHQPANPSFGGFGSMSDDDL